MDPHCNFFSYFRVKVFTSNFQPVIIFYLFISNAFYLIFLDNHECARTLQFDIGMFVHKDWNRICRHLLFISGEAKT